MTRHRWIFASVSLAAALLLWPAPAAHAQSPLTLVPNTINMFRDSRAANNAGIGPGEVLQYGADLQGGSAGASLTGVYSPTGFVDPSAICTPLAVNLNFCSNSTAFNVNRLAVPWSFQFVRGAEQVIVPGPDLMVNGGAILNPVPFPSSFTITSGATPVTPTLQWVLPEGFTPDAIRVNVYDRDDRFANGLSNNIHSAGLPATTTSYSLPAVLSSGRSLNVDGNYTLSLQFIETRGHATFTNNNAEILRRSSSFFDFTPRPPDVLAQSTFPTGTENWTTFLSGAPFPASNITWTDGVGNPGGAVSTLAPSEDRTTYFSNNMQFPAAMRAEPNNGLALSFDLSTIHADTDVFFTTTEDISVLRTTGLGSNNVRIILNNFFTAAPAAHPSYSHYEINFTTAQGWEYSENGIRTPATQEQIDGVLANATTLIIRGEYWSGPTADTTFLDNVVLFSRAVRPPIVTAISTPTFLQHRTADVIINGTNFQSGAIADFGPAVSVNAVSFVSATQVIANVTFLPAAGVSDRALHRPLRCHGGQSGRRIRHPAQRRPDRARLRRGRRGRHRRGRIPGPRQLPASRRTPSRATPMATASATPATTAGGWPTPTRPMTISNGVGDACATERVATLEQLTPPGGVLFGESVPVQVSVDFNCGATNCLAFCPNVYNLAFIVTDLTPGSPTFGQELDQTRLWEGPPVHTTNDATPVTGGHADLLDHRGSRRVLPAGGQSHLPGRGDLLQPRHGRCRRLRHRHHPDPAPDHQGRRAPTRALSAALAVTPEALGLTFDRVPIPSILHAVLCNIPGRQVTEVNLASVRLNGALLPVRHAVRTNVARL